MKKFSILGVTIALFSTTAVMAQSATVHLKSDDQDARATLFEMRSGSKSFYSLDSNNKTVSVVLYPKPNNIAPNKFKVVGQVGANKCELPAVVVLQIDKSYEVNVSKRTSPSECQISFGEENSTPK